MSTPELQTKLINWRAKAAAGTLTIEEMREAVLVLRGSRRSAAEASSAAKRSSSRGPARNADDLLGELGSL